MSDTLKGIGPGTWNSSKLTQAQEMAVNSRPVVFRIYTEDKGNLTDLVTRYFDGATLYLATGVWNSGVSFCAECGSEKGTLCHYKCSMSEPFEKEIVVEQSRVIEIVGTLNDMQSIVNLAGDIKVRNNQSAVLITWQTLAGRLDV